MTFHHVAITPLQAVISLESADPQYHASTPGDNSGWQYSGQFIWFLGVPISPHHFITAKHIGGSVGTPFVLHGDNYTTIGFTDHPTSDLRIWEVHHSKPFPAFAPLSSGNQDLGASAAIFGRGTLRGSAISVGEELKGWQWGASSDTKRWGRNVVTGELDIPGYGNTLYCDFDNPGIPGECHLSTGDSGGGLFVMEDGLWRLAGIHLSVDGPFNTTTTGAGFFGAIFDYGGLYIKPTESSPWELQADTAENKPSAFYSTRISTYLAWIQSVTGESGSLSNEDFTAWKHWYFSPTQRGNPAVTGPHADPDGDGIANLMEFALNLDPIFNERHTMQPASGLRGLPKVSVESAQLSIEFVRRTAASGAGLTYVPEFSSNLVDWESAGSESVTSVNPRWDRVVFTDAQIGDSSPRFARLRVVQTP